MGWLRYWISLMGVLGLLQLSRSGLGPEPHVIVVVLIAAGESAGEVGSIKVSLEIDSMKVPCLTYHLCLLLCFQLLVQLSQARCSIMVRWKKGRPR